MSDELEVVPPIVKRLAEEVHMTPISWLVADDHITIVFQEGQKLRFDRPGKAVVQSPEVKKTIASLDKAKIISLPRRRK